MISRNILDFSSVHENPTELEASCMLAGWLAEASFLFLYFSKKNYRNIFLVLDFTVLYPYRSAGGGKELYVNKNNFFCTEVLGGSLPPGRGAAGSHPKYKTPPFPSAPSFSAHEIQRGERGGVRDVKKPAKPCRIFEPATAGNQNSTLSK